MCWAIALLGLFSRSLAPWRSRTTPGELSESAEGRQSTPTSMDSAGQPSLPIVMVWSV